MGNQRIIPTRIAKNQLTSNDYKLEKTACETDSLKTGKTDAMPQLSILIPYSGNEKELETTLVSVLENRPYQCEVIVAHTGDYTDPYDLGDEVQFIEFADEDLPVASLVAQIVEQIDSPLLHLLSCGTRVSAGWTNDVIKSFEDPYVGSACPILLHEDGTVFCIGVENTALYRNRFVARHRHLGPLDYGRYEPVGPSQFAAFYRVDALREISCLDQFSESLFGLETGLALEAIGYENQVVENSIIHVGDKWDLTDEPGDSQTAIWRFAGSLGFTQGLSLSILGLASDLVSTPFSSRARKSLVQRLRGMVDWKTASEFRDFVDNARGPVTSGQTLPIQSYQLELSGQEPPSSRRAA